MLAIAIALFPVYVLEAGIRCYDFYGIYRFSRWAAIGAVEPANLLGLRYVRVFSTDTRGVMWVPLFLADIQGFTEVVSRLAGTSHPLTVALLTHKK